LKNLEKESAQFTKQLDKLNLEIANSLLGNSTFTPEQLSGAITNIQGQLKQLDAKIDLLKKEIAVEEDNYFDVKYIADELKNWEEKFDNADDDLKKAMLSRIVKKVTLGKDKVSLKLNNMLEEILKNLPKTV
jgi:site-specific DNA recombinase